MFPLDTKIFNKLPVTEIKRSFNTEKTIVYLEMPGKFIRV